MFAFVRQRTRVEADATKACALAADAAARAAAAVDTVTGCVEVVLAKATAAARLAAVRAAMVRWSLDVTVDAMGFGGQGFRRVTPSSSPCHSAWFCCLGVYLCAVL